MEPNKKYKQTASDLDVTRSETYLSTTSTIESDIDPLINSCMEKNTWSLYPEYKY